MILLTSLPNSNGGFAPAPVSTDLDALWLFIAMPFDSVAEVDWPIEFRVICTKGET